MNPHDAARGQLVLSGDGLSRGGFLRRQKQLKLVRRQLRRLAEQRQQLEVVVRCMNGVVLRQAVRDQQWVEEGGVTVGVAEALSRADDARGDAVGDLALRVRVDGNIVALPAQAE